MISKQWAWFVRKSDSDMLKRLVPDAPRQGSSYVYTVLIFFIVSRIHPYYNRKIRVHERAWHNKRCWLHLLESTFWHYIHNSKSPDTSWLRIANFLLDRHYCPRHLFFREFSLQNFSMKFFFVLINSQDKLLLIMRFGMLSSQVL